MEDNNHQQQQQQQQDPNQDKQPQVSIQESFNMQSKQQQHQQQQASNDIHPNSGINICAPSTSDEQQQHQHQQLIDNSINVTQSKQEPKQQQQQSPLKLSKIRTTSKQHSHSHSHSQSHSSSNNNNSNNNSNNNNSNQHQINNHNQCQSVVNSANASCLAEQKILNSHLSIVAKKDFCAEVRALADIRKFVSDAFILLDLNKQQVCAIVYEILDRLGKFRGLSFETVQEAKNLLFVEPEKPLLASTMQGMYRTKTDGRLAYDNSWLIAMCNLSSISKRHVAIAKLAQPTNFGRQSQEVRVLILILTPSKDKLTKSAWETGRTFATMLTDMHFRHRLYRAKNEYEFKIELLSMAESMAAPQDSIDELCKRHAKYQNFRNSLLSSPITSSSCSSDTFNNSNNQQSSVVITNQPTLDDKDTLDSPLNTVFALRLADAEAATQVSAIAKYEQQSSRSTSSSSNHSDNSYNSTKGSLLPLCAKLGCFARASSKLGNGLVDDFKRRSAYYWSDYLDGILGHRSLYKTTSTTIFLYVSVLLPCIAFGVVLTNTTDNYISIKKTMAGQAAGGILYALIGGQPLVVLMTTAPLCIYIKVIHDISVDLSVDFLAFYASVGLWMGVFLVLMSVTNSSNLMRYCSRSTEEIFAIFTAFAFGCDGIREAIRSFHAHYYEPACYVNSALQTEVIERARLANTAYSSSSDLNNQITSHLPNVSSSFLLSTAHNIISDYSPANPLLSQQQQPSTTATTTTTAAAAAAAAAAVFPDSPELATATATIFAACQREKCILFLFLMSGTLWLANSFSAFNQTPYLSPRKRELIKDYALAISVIIFSFIASYVFASIDLGGFEFGDIDVSFANISLLTTNSIFVACPLGFMLSVLFYIDQNICGAMVNNAPYKLKKGDYFHLDLLVVALLNILLSLFGFPWMQGKLPHSHLHAKALADYEERVDEGLVHQTIVNIRETRLTGLLCSLLIGASFFAAVPYPLTLIPLPVLSGVFLYTALSEFKSNSIVERVCLFFTEQAAYPPNHYIRRCPQRKIHLFTFVQLVQLAVVSIVGFYPNPYVKMAYPLVVATFVPIRVKLLPHIINSKYLNSLDHSPALVSHTTF